MIRLRLKARRPTEFATPAGTTLMVVTFKRVRAKKE